MLKKEAQKKHEIDRINEVLAMRNVMGRICMQIWKKTRMIWGKRRTGDGQKGNSGGKCSRVNCYSKGVVALCITRG